MSTLLKIIVVLVAVLTSIGGYLLFEKKGVDRPNQKILLKEGLPKVDNEGEKLRKEDNKSLEEAADKIIVGDEKVY